ncbi:hypothetical protein NQZ68_000490 [Dissostichus eleginoides]|nr:hypothetical protein NQZ68_000490 [Dissostichus eleginoides]
MRVTLTKTSFSSQCCCERRDVAHGYFLTATETVQIYFLTSDRNKVKDTYVMDNKWSAFSCFLLARTKP